jgi:APA family basic amino acid/polyamine antiporter
VPVNSVNSVTSAPSSPPIGPPFGHPPSATGLLKILGVVFGATMIVANTIGVGILRTPGDVAAALPSPAWFLGVWIIGALYSLCGAMTVAELAAMLPKSGGQYVFARRAMGEYAGFVIGWTDWISSAAAIAAASIGLGELTAEFWPQMAPARTAIAFAITLAFGVLHWIGVRSGDVSTRLIGITKVLTLLAVAVACLVTTPAASSHAVTAAALPVGAALATAVVIAFQNVMYTYDGWTGYAYFGGEVTDARRVPRAMALGVVCVAVVYVALNAAFLHTLGIGGLAGEKFAAKAAAVSVFGTYGERIVTAVMAVSILGNVSAIMMLLSRVPYAMAEDGLLPHAMARVNRGGTPDVAHFASVAVVLVLIASGTFASVLALAAFFYVMQYGVSFASLFVLRVREPNLPRPYRAWGYPVIPAIVLLGAAAFIVGSIVGDRQNSVRSILVLVASYPVYRASAWWRERRREAVS